MVNLIIYRNEGGIELHIWSQISNQIQVFSSAEWEARASRDHVKQEISGLNVETRQGKPIGKRPQSTHANTPPFAKSNVNMNFKPTRQAVNIQALQVDLQFNNRPGVAGAVL